MTGIHVIAIKMQYPILEDVMLSWVAITLIEKHHYSQGLLNGKKHLRPPNCHGSA